MQQPLVFLLDNVDSFTYNLVDELRRLNIDIRVYRNHIPAARLLDAMRQVEDRPVMLMLSPGPGAPKDAGCMPELLGLVAGRYPVLGICLGHQAIVEHYGGHVGKAGNVVHGKASRINLKAHPVFQGLASPLSVARYHSLVATEVPASLEVLAEYQGMPMAVYHAEDKMLGFQFHPESILTAQGSQLLWQSVHFLSGDKHD